MISPLDPGDDGNTEILSRLPALAVKTFFWSKEKNDSMAALSPHAPTRPIDPVRPLCFKVRTNSLLRNWDPRSESNYDGPDWVAERNCVAKS